MKTIYFVRHGETDNNTKKIFQTPDSQLSGRGREQARYIAERVAKLPIETIVSSPMDRAWETASIIGERIERPVERVEYLKERIAPKEIRGTSMESEEGKRIVEEGMAHFHKKGWQYSDEENFDALNARTELALAELANRPESHILAVTHGIFARALLAKVLLGKDLTGETCRDIMSIARATNTGLTVVRYGFPAEKGFFGKSPSGWQLLVWNDHAHLG